MSFIDGMLLWLAKAATEFLLTVAVLVGIGLLIGVLHWRDERAKARRQSRNSGGRT
jgi:hypothetical protein